MDPVNLAGRADPAHRADPARVPYRAPAARGHAQDLSPLQEACLDFCIELLNQRIQVHEYDCALVCALAVLGCRFDGW